MKNSFALTFLFLIMPYAAEASPSLSISAVAILDEGDDAQSVMSVDVTREICDEETEELENFFETILHLSIYNNSNENLVISHYRFTVANAFNEQRRHRSRRFATHQTLAPQSTTQSVDILFLTVNEDIKTYLGNSRAIPSTLGPHRVTVELWATNPNGQSERATIRHTVNFTSINRCFS